MCLFIELSTALALLILSILIWLPLIVTVSKSPVVTRGYLFMSLLRCLTTAISTGGYIALDVTAGSAAGSI